MQSQGSTRTQGKKPLTLALSQREGPPLMRRPSADAVAGNGAPLNTRCAPPSADAVAGNGCPLSYSLRSPSADAVAGGGDRGACPKGNLVPFKEPTRVLHHDLVQPASSLMFLGEQFQPFTFSVWFTVSHGKSLFFPQNHPSNHPYMHASLREAFWLETPNLVNDYKPFALDQLNKSML